MARSRKLSSWARWPGSTKIASDSETSSVAMNAKGMTAMNLPITPETKSSGMNVITVVITPDTTDGTTSAVPSIAA